ncbi:undecaprenyl-phosphate glucose phosphotransferase [Stappia taiwanensis]|uniref:Undecaprenyl-phosphate glucose phosphotransferase n=1 Tax=Stappia taiwanensis TaxID=992267 RepID=A0A838XFL7_9HYPH|nr:undecaprenyl-phosphate glucose phosphotransferase [Stappia taiwanensis]MBA4610229.1 undecaprenyl-phosphate glucose phosphotransferase [Stappia taiwanensis]GGE77914.1 undecaprenyl-phosphate glucose phosphotransferase [Stappia taiwanensis]
MTNDPTVRFLKDIRSPETDDAAARRKQESEQENRHPGSKLSPQALEIAESLQDSVISPSVLGGTVRLLDMAIVILAGLATFASTAIGGYALEHLLLVGAALILAVAFFQAADCYQLPVMRTVLSQGARMTIAWTLVFGVFLVVKSSGVLLTGTSELWLTSWYALGLAALLVSRLTLSILTRRWTRQGRLERRAVIVGGGTAAADLIHEIEMHQDNDIRICGIFDDRKGDRSPNIVAGYPKLGTVADLVEFARIARIDMLIVTIPLRAEKRLLEFLKTLWVLPVDIRLSAHMDKMRFRDRASSFIGTVPFVDVVHKPMADWDSIAKRAFDLVFACVMIVLLSPVMIGTAIAIRMESKGPILFRQKRYGFNNEVIEVLKFRSMYHEMADPTAKKVVTRDDPRVTRVGKFIRRSSIDELPQLFNVLRGDLSLVGPRPHAVNAHTNDTLWDDVVDGYFARHKVKPGVTGWAQINGWRGEVDTPEKIQKRVEYDVYYIENWSILFDLKILFSTPFALLNTENAY